jgi:hypothetical protein
LRRYPRLMLGLTFWVGAWRSETPRRDGCDILPLSGEFLGSAPVHAGPVPQRSTAGPSVEGSGRIEFSLLLLAAPGQTGGR